MKRLLAQLKESTRNDYDPEEKGEVVGVGEHHGGDIQVYFAHKVTKLREVQANSWKEPSSTIFKGCIVYINGLTDPPIDEMRRLIGTNGGECIQYRAVKITHLVCNYYTDAQLKLEYAKVKLNANRHVYYVTDGWVKESIRHGRRLDENEFVPAGIAKQHGHNLTTLFSSANATSSSTLALSVEPFSSTSVNVDKTHQNDDRQLSKRPMAPDHGYWGDGPTTLTASQQDFIAFLPHELREDALKQIESMRESTFDMDTGINSGVQHGRAEAGSNNSSKSDTISAWQNDKESVSPCECAFNAVSGIPQEAALRKQNLTDLVDHLHRSDDGSHCSSKVTRQRVTQYLQQLVVSLVGMPCPPDCSVGSVGLAELLSDYVRWLRSESKYDQAQFFAVQLRRQVEGVASKPGTNEAEAAAVTALREVSDLVSKTLTTMPTT